MLITRFFQLKWWQLHNQQKVLKAQAISHQNVNPADGATGGI
jgi:hypothetical protein